MRALSLVVAAVVLCAAEARRPPLVVVSFDKMEWSSWRAGTTSLPNLDAMKVNGSYAGVGVVPTFSSETVPNLYTIATGLYEESHGIVGDVMYDPSLKEHFDASALAANTTQWFQGEPIWVTAQKHGLKTAVLGWPGADALIGGTQPTYFEAYTSTPAAEDRVARIGELLAAAEADAPALIMAHFRASSAWTLETMDDVVGSVRTAIANADLASGVNFVVVTPHGYAALSGSEVVVLADAFSAITDTKRFTIDQVSPYVSIHAATDADADEAYEELSAALTGNVTFYRKGAIPSELHVSASVRTGDVVGLAAEGWSLKLSADESSVCCLSGGYNNSLVSMRGLFVATGPDFRQNFSAISTFSVTDYHALFAQLLAVPAAANNGTESMLFDALNRNEYRAHWNATAWIPSQNDITVYPLPDTKIVSGLKFDIAVQLPRLLPGVDVDSVVVKLSTGAISSLCAGTQQQKVETLTHVEYYWRECQVVKENVTLTATSGTRSTTLSWITLVPKENSTAKKAKNVILFVGDGMTLAMLTATRLLNAHGKLLPTDLFDYSATQHTYALETIVTDSATSASALNAGHKTINAALGVYPDSSAVHNDGAWFEAIGEYVKRVHSKKIGVVTTSSVSDATPAAVWAHCSDRSDSKLIMEQAASFGVDVLMGGGQAMFTTYTSLPGLFEAANYTYGKTKDAMYAYLEEALAPNSTATEKYIGMYSSSHMAVHRDRMDDASAATQPHLYEMANAALRLLVERDNNENGFYLMIEAASIDKQSHLDDFTRMLADSLELQRTVKETIEYLEGAGLMDETLIVVTSDHSNGGYDVYGTVDTDDTEDYNRAIKVYQFAEWPDWVAPEGTFEVKNWYTAKYTFAGTHVNHPSYREDFKAKKLPAGWLTNAAQRATLQGILLADNLGLTTANAHYTESVHTAADVMVYAKGVGAHKFRGGQINTNVFLHMFSALVGGYESDAPERQMCATSAPATSTPTPRATPAPTQAVTVAPDPTALCDDDDSVEKRRVTIALAVLLPYLFVMHFVVGALYYLYAQASVPSSNPREPTEDLNKTPSAAARKEAI